MTSMPHVAASARVPFAGVFYQADTLNNLQVVSRLRCLLKGYLYAGMKQSAYSLTLLRIEKGKARLSTVSELFHRMGYAGESNSWRKTI